MKTPHNCCLPFTKTSSWTWELACHSKLKLPTRSYVHALPSSIQFFKVTHFWDVSSWKNGLCCSYVLMGRVGCCSINCWGYSWTRCAGWLCRVISLVVLLAFLVGLLACFLGRHLLRVGLLCKMLLLHRLRWICFILRTGRLDWYMQSLSCMSFHRLTA